MPVAVRYIFVSVLLMTAGLFLLAGPGYNAHARNPSSAGNPGSFADLAEVLSPAVVNISSTQKAQETSPLEGQPHFPEFPPGSPFEDFFERFMEHHGQGGPVVPQASLGSGFIIDAEKGYIVTNNHVVRDADEVRITFHDDETVEAEVIGRDEKTDLAVLKVETDKTLMAVGFGDSDTLRVGDWILAIGNPFGLGGTVTAGIVSARQRDIQSGPYDDYIQTDASINRGNSGGPMFNLAGKVIGINTAIFSPSGGSVGIGFAIPSALAQPVIKQIIKYGRTRRGWLGVRVQKVTDEIAESLGLDEARGALVASVTEGSPAAEAGVKTGDVILMFNGQDVAAMRHLPRLVAETEIGTKARMTLWRSKKEKTVQVEIGELEKAEDEGLLDTTGQTVMTPQQDVEIEALGLRVKTLGPNIRRRYGLDDDVSGVVITNVAPSSDAANKGLRSGDVILEVNQTMIKTVQDVQKEVQTAADQEQKSVLLLLSRDGDVRFVALALQ